MDGQQIGAVGAHLVGGDFPEVVVLQGFVRDPETHSGQQAVLGVAAERKVSRLDQQTIGVVLMNNGVGIVQPDCRDAEIGVVGEADIAGDGAGPSGLGR